MLRRCSGTLLNLRGVRNPNLRVPITNRRLRRGVGKNLLRRKHGSRRRETNLLPAVKRAALLPRRLSHVRRNRMVKREVLLRRTVVVEKTTAPRASAKLNGLIRPAWIRAGLFVFSVQLPQPLGASSAETHGKL